MDIAELGLIDDEEIALDMGALHLAALDHPDVDLESYYVVLDEIVDRVDERGGDAEDFETQAGVLAEVIANEFGFHGDRDTYDDPDNADLIRVIDRRRGLPVSLTILYVAAARRLDWTADALSTPGHVLARVGTAGAGVLIDPFNHGLVVDHDAFAALFQNVLRASSFEAISRAPAMSNRAVLVRLLTNQASRAEARGDGARALSLYDTMTKIAPAMPHPWWDRARLQAAIQDNDGARASLGAMLETTRDPALRARVNAMLDALARSLDN